MNGARGVISTGERNLTALNAEISRYARYDKNGEFSLFKKPSRFLYGDIEFAHSGTQGAAVKTKDFSGTCFSH